MERIAPIWVTHPLNGKTIDVAPFLITLSQFDSSEHAQPGQGAYDALLRINRAMDLATHNPDLISPEQLVDLFVDLHRLQDMVKHIPEAPAEGVDSVTPA